MLSFSRETEGDDYNEEEIDKAMSRQHVQDHEDHSDTEENSLLEEYDLDNYDEDGEGKHLLSVCHKQQMVIITQTFPGVVMTGAGMAGLTYFANNQDDPYITLKDPVCNILLYPSCTKRLLVVRTQVLLFDSCNATMKMEFRFNVFPTILYRKKMKKKTYI
jgi:hypothetical protein